MRVVPSTWMIVTWVPGSMTVASDDAPRQSSPSTLTRPGPPGPMRSVTMAVLPSSAATPVRSSDPGTRDETDNPCYRGPNRQAGEPEPGGEHLPDEKADRQEKPNQPIFHMVLSCNPCTRFAIQLVPTPCGAAMLARSLLLVSVVALWSPAVPVAAQISRQVLKGDSVAVYNLVGELRVEAGSGSDVVVEIARGGADAAKLDIQSGPLRGRETLRIIYPDDVISMPQWGRGWNTTLR